MENNAESPQKSCRNCQSSLSGNAIYCTQCSQKYTTGRIPIGELIKDFFSQQFNFDSKLLKTFLALFFPGKLTLEYFRGKHKSYASPIRTFLVTAIILFAIVSLKTGDSNMSLDEDDPRFVLSESYFAARIERDKALQNLESINQAVDKKFNNPTVSAALDSVFLDFKKVEGGGSDSSTTFNFSNPTLKQNIKVAEKDIAELSLNELADKYGFSDTFGRFLFKQQIKALKNGKGLFQYFMGKLTLMILLMMPFLAAILKLLYVRRDFYYVEHLIFSFHYHAFAFLVTAFLVLTGKFLGGWIALFIVSIFVYQFAAMKQVYGQSFWKTFFKFWVLNFMYSFLAVLFFTLTAIVSFVLF